MDPSIGEDISNSTNISRDASNRRASAIAGMQAVLTARVDML
jgi:hypothetical protein